MESSVIQSHNYIIKNAIKTKKLSSEETVALIEQLRTCDPDSKEHTRILEQLVQGNMGLVTNIAIKRMNRSSRDMADMLQEGAIALMQAVKSFDPKKETKFSTYATQKIIRRISLYNNKNDNVVHPTDWMTIYKRKVLRAEEELAQELCKEPDKISNEAVAERSGLPLQRVKAIRYANTICITEDHDNDIFEKGEYDQDCFTKEALRDIINHIPDELQMREIVSMYIGLDGPKMSNIEISKVVNLSREGVRQRLKKAMGYLRNKPELIENLRYLVNNA